MREKRSAIILAGGSSNRINGDKGLRKICGKPLVSHVIKRVSATVDEVLLVLSSEEQLKTYSGKLEKKLKLLVDLYEEGSPLVGAITGFKQAKGDYALIIGCDMPLTPSKVIEMLFDAAEGYNGAVFQWPNGWIEPLNAVYRVDASLKMALKLYEIGELKLRMVLNKLGNVRKIPIDRLKEIDKDLLTLHDTDTEHELLVAENILKNQEKNHF
jgi:molybdopterin-guanine dinucleotide biosynthesis protein A